MKPIFLFVLLIASSAHAQWIKQSVDTSASFRGLSVVSEKIVWVSGTGGTVIRTVDGGKSWKVITVPGAEKLDFRDIEAFDANTAYILSIGNGESSRIYKTTDGGASWKLQFQNKNEKAFFDAIACWDKNNCIAMSDPVDNKYVLIRTADGETWHPMNTSEMPAAKDGEAAFAASGTCLLTVGKDSVFLVSGGNDARVFRSGDRGKTWTVADTPIVKGTAGSGVFSIAFRNELHGVIVGGNYEKPADAKNNVGFTSDGGKTWFGHEGLSGYRSGVAYIDDRTMIAAGTNGTDISGDRGKTWKKIGSEDLNAVAAKGKKAVWAVGPKGNVFSLDRSSLDTNNLREDRTEPGDPPNVTALNLSHNEIASNCPVSNTKCSNNNSIAIRTTAIEWGGPHKYVYTVTAGRVVGDGPTVEWNLSDVKPGKYTITAGISVPYFRGTRWGVLGKTETRDVAVR